MKVENHKSKDRIILELEENEFFLIAHLIERSSQKTRKDNVVKEPIDVKMNDKFQLFIDEL